MDFFLEVRKKLPKFVFQLVLDSLMTVRLDIYPRHPANYMLDRVICMKSRESKDCCDLECDNFLCSLGTAAKTARAERVPASPPRLFHKDAASVQHNQTLLSLIGSTLLPRVGEELR